jgi:hypothetical protein
MESGESPNVDDAIRDIAGLVTQAYRRRARLRFVPVTPGPLAVTMSSGAKKRSPSYGALSSIPSRPSSNDPESGG